MPSRGSENASGGAGSSSTSASGGQALSSGGATIAGGSGGGSTSGGTGTGGGPGEGSESGGAASELDITDISGGLDGYLYKGECSGGDASFECPLADCQNGVFRQEVEFQIGELGESVHNLVLHVYGVVELRSDYQGGTRQSGSADNVSSAGDFFYEGGSYTPGTGYNVYSLQVRPAIAGVQETEGQNNYFLNARDSSPEGHEVYALNYEASIRVQSQSTVTFLAYDPNCLQIMNNAETVRPQGTGTGPNGSLVLDLNENTTAAPIDFTQPLSTNGRTGQWIYIDVVSAEPQ